jgi:hypothetical protein
VSSTQRLAMIAVALVIVVVGFIALRPGSDNGDDSSDTTQSTTSTSGSGQAGTTGSGTTGSETEDSGGAAAPAPPKVATITVVNGRPKGGVQRITFAKGDRIRLKVNSDTADEVHIHGYDIHKDVEAGGSVRFSFPASIDGRFEIELENARQQLAELEVTP